MRKLTLFLVALLPLMLSAQLSIGDEAPDFNLINVDGDSVSLADMPETEGIILVFTCNHCPVAKLYEQRIIELDAAYADEGYPVVAINPNSPRKKPLDNYPNMQKRAEEKGYTFPYLADPTGETAKAYGATRTPEIYLLERDDEGKLFLAYTGAIDNNSASAEDADAHYVAEAIANLKKGKAADPNFTKAIGCTIKWASTK
ncbi:MAG: thioredoxin family protein [Bacteroidota bacterium]